MTARQYHNTIVKRNRQKQILSRVLLCIEWCVVIVAIALAVRLGIKPDDAYASAGERKDTRTVIIKEGEVTGIDEITTCDGNVWEYDTDISTGSNVTVVFFDMGTSSVNDDEILYVTKLED